MVGGGAEMIKKGFKIKWMSGDSLKLSGKTFDNVPFEIDEHNQRVGEGEDRQEQRDGRWLEKIDRGT